MKTQWQESDGVYMGRVCNYKEQKTYRICFGPGVWFTMHELARMRDKCLVTPECFKDFLWFLAKNLPCSICRNHFREILNQKVEVCGPDPKNPCCTKVSKKKRVDLSSPCSFDWSVNVHNNVNTRIGHPAVPLSVITRIYDTSKFLPSDYQYMQKSPFFNLEIGTTWMLDSTCQKNKDLYCVIRWLYKEVNLCNIMDIKGL